MDCLVTKLKGTVEDSSLKRVGELRIGISYVDSPTAKTQGLRLSFNKDMQIEIIGNGYFTDSGLSVNNGKILDFTASIPQDFFVSNGNFEIAILDKYSLTELQLYATGYVPSVSESSNRSINIEDLKYSTNLVRLVGYSNNIKGDISSLKNIISLDSIDVASEGLFGNISELSGLVNLSIINISSSRIYGDLQALNNLTRLNTINLSSTEVTGDISELSDLQNLTMVNLSNCTGDLSSLTALSKLSNIALLNSTITGDLAKMPNTTKYVSFSNSNATLTWSSRDFSANIMAINGYPTVESVDTMLINLANCTKAISGSEQSWYKEIRVKGSKTSASDTAVSTLEEKGYTVYTA